MRMRIKMKSYNIIWNIGLSLLIHHLLASQSKELLLLRQRSRLDTLFSYQIKECVASSTLVAPSIYSVPTPSDGIPVHNTYSTLSSVRAVITDIAFASTPKGLVDIVRTLNIVQPLLWTMEFECLANLDIPSNEKDVLENCIGEASQETNTQKLNRKKSQNQQLSSDRKSFSSKSIFCALSQCILGEPALDPREAEVFYCVLETAAGFYFGSATESLSPLNNIRYNPKSAAVGTGPVVRSMSSSMSRSSTDSISIDSNSDASSDSNTINSNFFPSAKSPAAASTATAREFWAGRPFIFSAALNIEIAEAVMNILKSKLIAKESNKKEKERREGKMASEGNNGEKRTAKEKKERIFTVLDPCCGSGTTLFIGRRLGFRAIGSDVNDAFIEGTRDNLAYAGYCLENDEDSGKDNSNDDYENGISHGRRMLQLYHKDASYASSPWTPFSVMMKRRKSNQNTLTPEEKSIEKAVEKSKDETLKDSNEEANVVKSDQFQELSDQLSDQFSPIPTAGRTKRFLQERRMARITPDNPEKTQINPEINPEINPHFLGSSESKKNSKSGPKTPWGMVDCVFCNFPWGENVFEYYNETENILKILGKELNKGCECAFITKQMITKELLEESGFSLVKTIPVGLEKGKKEGGKDGKGEVNEFQYSKRKKESNSGYGNNDKDNTGDCFVTFAAVR